MANVLPAAPISAFPVVIAGPTGPTGPSGSTTTVSIEAVLDMVKKLTARIETLEAARDEQRR